VFIAGLFVLAAERLAELARRTGHDDDAESWTRAARTMRVAVDAHGWDGEWFLRAYDAHGRPLGTGDDVEGRIFLEPQGICVMAGIGLEDGRAQQALNAVSENLDSGHGIALVRPPFTRYRRELGEISSYPPGYKENGGIFCHVNPWAMIAAVKLGDAERAYAWYRAINPSVRESISEVHRCEPYVYAQMIAGPDAPTHGEAKNSWLTGTAAWNYVAITQWILGIRPSHDGLVVDPAVPPSWEGFTATRRFRGATYRIRVRRTAGGEEPGLVVDGSALPGRVVPIAPEGTEVEVQVLLDG
jgi:cellobiose phosphorylase